MSSSLHNIQYTIQSCLTVCQLRQDGKSSRASNAAIGTAGLHLSPEHVARFWGYVRKSPGCWIWTGARVRGYGQFSVGHGVPKRAHRVAWTLANGPIPDDLHILHSCDVPLCCNPAHMRLGTHQENMRDSVGKGRKTVPRHRKLTLRDRLDIYNAPRGKGTGQELAAQYGVSETCISLIRKGRFVTHAKAKKERAA